jgi:hypothetical protein
MSDSFNGLYQLDKDDADHAEEVLGWAFYDDPLVLYAYAKGERNQKDLHNFFLTAVKYCPKYGEADAPTAVIEGIAM